MDILQAHQHIARLDALAQHRSAPFMEGRTLRWRVFGQASRHLPLVLVHGGHGNWLHWSRNIDVLMQDRQVLVPDLPGFGESDDLPEGTAEDAVIARLADALMTSLASLLGGKPEIDIAAFSLGAIVSAQTAVRRGGVRRLALLGCPASETPRRPKAKMTRWRHLDDAAQNAALRHNLLTHMMYADSNVDALAFRAYADGIKATRLSTRGAAHSVPLKDVLRPYTAPVMFLYGEHDVICTPALAKTALQNAAIQRECHVLAGGGHWVQHERADLVNDALTRWFSVARSTTPAVAEAS